MPNVEGLSGGLLATWLLDAAPLFPISSRIGGVFGMLWIGTSSCILGYSSIGQSVVGVLLGIILHFYSTRMPQFFIFVDAIFEIILAVVFVKLDSTVYAPADPANLKWLLIWGIAFEVFTCLMIFRHYKSYDTLPHLWLSLCTMNASVYQNHNRNDAADENSLDTTDSLVDIDFIKVADVFYIFAFLALFGSLLFVAFATQYFGW